MSEEENSDSQLVTAEYKDGQLQIVEVTPFDSERNINKETRLLEDVASTSDGHSSKYVQVLDSDKGVMHLDLLNLTLVRAENGEESYRLISEVNSENPESGQTLTCVLQSSDGEEQDNDQYVVVEGDTSMMFLETVQPDDKHIIKSEDFEIQQKKPDTPHDILERTKALQRAKMILAENVAVNKRGRKRKYVTPVDSILTAPSFKMFLYACKMCPFKCNAIKELSAHKLSEHAKGNYRGGRPNPPALQCARCPFRGTTHSILMTHVQEKHSEETTKDSDELLESADVLVCGACGFESSSRPTFKKHIDKMHGPQAHLNI